MSRSLVICALVLFGAGCASTTIPTARVLSHSEMEASAAADISIASPQLSPGTRANLPYPMLSGGFRYGFGVADVGAQGWGFGTVGIWGFGASFDAKVGIVQRPESQRGFQMALAPGAGYHQLNLGGAPTHVLVARLPILLAYNTGRGDQLVLAPRLDYQRGTAVDVNPVDAWLPGLSVLYSWRVHDWIDIRPSLTALYSPVSFNGTLDDPRRTGYSFVTAGVGAAFLLERD